MVSAFCVRPSDDSHAILPVCVCVCGSVQAKRKGAKKTSKPPLTPPPQPTAMPPPAKRVKLACPNAKAFAEAHAAGRSRPVCTDCPKHRPASREMKGGPHPKPTGKPPNTTPVWDSWSNQWLSHAEATGHKHLSQSVISGFCRQLNPQSPAKRAHWERGGGDATGGPVVLYLFLMRSVCETVHMDSSYRWCSRMICCARTVVVVCVRNVLFFSYGPRIRALPAFCTAVGAVA